MRFSLQPEPRPEQRMQTVTLDEIMTACENIQGGKPALEYYFSPPKKQAFIKDFLHYLNTELLEAKHGNLYRESYLALILSFQFTSPLLEISSEKVKFSINRHCSCFCFPRRHICYAGPCIISGKNSRILLNPGFTTVCSL